jgi:hypothetical protein
MVTDEVPAAQLAHPLAPLAALYWPAAHRLHSCAPAEAANEPGAQARQAPEAASGW